MAVCGPFFHSIHSFTSVSLSLISYCQWPKRTLCSKNLHCTIPSLQHILHRSALKWMQFASNLVMWESFMPSRSARRGIKEKCGRTGIEPNSPSHPITLHHKSLALPLIQGRAGLVMWHIACVWACVCVQECVFAYYSWEMREGESEKGGGDLGVMRASKIMVPRSIRRLNLIC